MTDTLTITKSGVRKLLKVVDAGLSIGLGSPEPGKMCVEAAVCYAMGLPHGDNPTCVGSLVRRFKITLNDSAWSSDQARAAGMRKLAVAQLGSKDIDQDAFKRIVVEQTIRRVVPIALRAAAKMNPKHADALEIAAKECESHGTVESAKKARKSAYAATDAVYAAADAADAAAYAAADAAADADAYAAADAADAAADAAYAAAYAKSSARDGVLLVSAQIGLEALIELKSPGCEWLYLCESKPHPAAKAK